MQTLSFDSWPLRAIDRTSIAVGVDNRTNTKQCAELLHSSLQIRPFVHARIYSDIIDEAGCILLPLVSAYDAI